MGRCERRTKAIIGLARAGGGVLWNILLPESGLRVSKRKGGEPEVQNRVQLEEL